MRKPFIDHSDSIMLTKKRCKRRGCRFSNPKPEYFDFPVQKTKSELKHLHAVLRFKK